MRDGERIPQAVLLLAALIVVGCSSSTPTTAPESAAPKPVAASGPVSAGAPQPASPATAALPPLSPDERKALGPSLVALSAGAYIVERPSEWMASESAYAMLDENPGSKWASKRGVVTPQTIVLALPERTVLKTLEFDNAQIDQQFAGCSAKDVTVEVSDTSATEGFRKIAEVSLADRADNQRFPAAAEVPGRWLRLTVKNNHTTDQDSTIELNEFRGYGTQLTQTPQADMSGTYDFYFTGKLHVKQEGSSFTGCYESRRGLVKGGIEGHIAKFAWYEDIGDGKSSERGQAVMILPADEKQPAVGVWWETGYQAYNERILVGPRTTTEIGTCPHWKGGVEQTMLNDLDAFGRARVYGINFDIDSDKLRPESKPTLDKIASILKLKKEWKLTIEGHTDSTATAEHNQALSERRAASVKAYLQAAGVDAARLKTAGFGATKPIAPNDNELGRAQNRRVELVKQ